MEDQKMIATRPYLTFCLGEELFALEIWKVREVLEMSPVTKIPQSPQYMKGVINLRGSVVTVVDLRVKFGMEKAPVTVDTSIVILELKYNQETIIIGVIVDSVKEVLELRLDEIDSAPRIGIHVSNDYIQGIGKKDSIFIILLDMDKIFSTTELTAVKNITES
jgi:purine-binding chemotaxis protein CheW